MINILIKKVLNKIRNKIVTFVIFYKYAFCKNIEIKRQNKLFNTFELDLSKKSLVKIDENLMVKRNVSLRAREYSELIIGKNVFLNNNCIITCRSRIIIEDDVIIGPNVVIFDHDHDYKSIDRKRQYINKDIFIGKNVWIGANACILKGSYIGTNSVIAAGSIVNGIIPENSIYYGDGKIKKIGD